MVEAEEEYVEQLDVLISCFLRPFKMAASSKNPPCSHEDINSIFLNSETVLFLHQIFLKGLTARMESWPTLVLGTSLGGTPLFKNMISTIYLIKCSKAIFHWDTRGIKKIKISFYRVYCRSSKFNIWFYMNEINVNSVLE